MSTCKGRFYEEAERVMEIDICMTAALRPDIVKRTIESIKNNLRLDVHTIRLIVDIAPIGELRYTQPDLLTMMTDIFPGKVVGRCLHDSIQAEALRWSWLTSTSPFIFQWEDDWVLEKPVNVHHLLIPFLLNDRLGMLYLDRADKSVHTHYTNGQVKKIGDFMWSRVKGKSLGGPPAILRREYIDGVKPLLDGVTCLDILSSTDKAQKVLSRWDICIYTGPCDNGKFVRDIGKQWKKDNGLRMVKGTKRGVTWLKEN